jgi:hypothetical protein
MANISSSTDANAIHDDTAAEISAITEKTTPVSTDLVIIEDSAASNAKKRVQVGNLPGGSITSSLSDTSYSGTVTDWTVSGLTFGQCVYMTTTNHTAALADANLVGKMPVVGLYLSTNLVLTFGHIRQDTWSFGTAGKRVYVDGSGEPTVTAPSGSGDYVQIIGETTSATSIYFNPSLTEVKLV